MQLWQYDIGMNVEVPKEVKQGSGDEDTKWKSIDLTGYDVLEILHTHPHLNFSGDISREFNRLEKIIEELRGRLPGNESRPDSNADE